MALGDSYLDARGYFGIGFSRSLEWIGQIENKTTAKQHSYWILAPDSPLIFVVGFWSLA